MAHQMKLFTQRSGRSMLPGLAFAVLCTLCVIMPASGGLFDHIPTSIPSNFQNVLPTHLPSQLPVQLPAPLPQNLPTPLPQRIPAPLPRPNIRPVRPVQMVYPVGGNGVWALGSRVNYNRWASSRVFRVNQFILFKFNPTTENLMVVSAAEYIHCSPRRPAVVYRTGNVVFKLARRGTYFFISGVRGHCAAGVKMMVKVR
ncbi:hypothetical protein KP509_29G064200 [Ceratopteris richardii]|uniref:Phytocyanin domain-containing protein n=1 Tax=Ceratopteris richardii TaxID=49495 RepID=A0A8T2R7M2_CERRI|nr:hypothetical protein KP509_29G064200 [Ceratopteris richardii]